MTTFRAAREAPPDATSTGAPPGAGSRAERLFGLLAGLTFLGSLGVHYVVSAVLPSLGFPTPFSADETIRRFFVENRPEIRALSAVDVMTAILLLGFVGAVAGWLRRFARERHALVAVAFGSGVLASAVATLSALGLWVLSQSEVTDDPALVRALHGLVYQAGGPALVLFSGLFMGASSLALRSAPTVPAWVPKVGMAGATVSAAAVPAMYWEPVTWTLPASRFFLGAWVLGVCLALSRGLVTTSTAHRGDGRAAAPA